MQGLRVSFCLLSVATIYAWGAPRASAQQAAPSPSSPTPASAPAPRATAPINIHDTTPQPYVAPGIDNGVPPVSGFAPSDVGNLAPTAPYNRNAMPPPVEPQNRVLPSNADTMRNAQSTNPNASRDSRTGNPRADAYSQSWLLDSMANLEAEQKQKRGQTTQATRDARSKRDNQRDDLWPNTDPNSPNSRLGQKDLQVDADEIARDKEAAAFANNPLANYLDKWISSSNGGATTASAFNNATGYSNSSANEAAAAIARSVDASGRRDAAIAPNAQQSAASYNPYLADLDRSLLDATGPNIVTPPPPMPGPTSQDPASALITAQPGAASGDAKDSTLPANSAFIIKNLEPPPEPAKPILDDKKYFPQMQRF